MKYYRFLRLKEKELFNILKSMPMPMLLALPILVPITLILVLISGLEAAMFVLGAIIVVPVDWILTAFNKALVWVIEKVFMRGRKIVTPPFFETAYIKESNVGILLTINH